MHKCVVHFIPLNKQLPSRKAHPGFIVQKVYDTVHKRLWKLTDNDYEDDKQSELELLVQKTMSRLGDLPDIESEEPVFEQEDQKNKRLLRKRTVSPLDISRSEDTTSRTDQNSKETPGSCPPSTSEYHAVLVKFEVVTGDSLRDRWLEKLLQAVQHVCLPADGASKDEKGKSSPEDIKDGGENKGTESANGSEEKVESLFNKYWYSVRHLICLVLYNGND